MKNGLILRTKQIWMVLMKYLGDLLGNHSTFCPGMLQNMMNYSSNMASIVSAMLVQSDSPQKIFVRMSLNFQTCEVFLSGYRFIVLNKAFLIHDGFKSEQKFHHNKKNDEIKNRQNYNLFLRSLKQKYPQSLMKCNI